LKKFFLNEYAIIPSNYRVFGETQKSCVLDDFALVIRRSFVIMYEVSRWQEFLQQKLQKQTIHRQFFGGWTRGDRKNVITANVSMQLPQDFVCG